MTVQPKLELVELGLLMEEYSLRLNGIEIAYILYDSFNPVDYHKYSAHLNTFNKTLGFTATLHEALDLILAVLDPLLLLSHEIEYPEGWNE